MASLMPVKSYFWSCLNLSDECPLIAKFDPNLYYYAVCILGFYAAFVMIGLADLHFFWSLDVFQDQIEYYVDVIRNKVRQVETYQKKMISTQERTEKQLKRSDHFKNVINALRLGLNDDSFNFDELTNKASNFLTQNEIDTFEEYSDTNSKTSV